MAESAGSADLERRWAEALDILNGTGDPALERRARDSQKRVIVVLAAALALGLIPAVVQLLTHAHSPFGGHRSGLPQWRWLFGGTFAALRLVLTVVALVRLVRSGQATSGLATPTRVLRNGQRMQLLKQVRGQAPVDSARLALSSTLQGDSAVDVTPLLDILWPLPMLISVAMLNDSVWLLLAVVLVLLLYPVVAVVAGRDAKRATAFLAQHGQADSEVSHPG